MPAYILDTNVLSELTRRQPSPSVVAFLSQASDLYLSTIVLHELEFGLQCVADPQRRGMLQIFLTGIRQQFHGRILDVDIEIAETGGRLLAFEKSQGRVLAELDALIAATALVRRATLVTRNIRDFENLGIPLLNPWLASTV